MAMRFALFSDIIGMAYDTLRSNKLRASLTILGVVIGITAIVGMTSMIRGFDESLRDSIRQLGPNTLFVAKFSGLSFAAGKEFKDLIKRPVLTVADAKAIEREAPSAGKVDVWLGAWGQQARERAYYKAEKTKELSVIGVSENYAAVNYLEMEGGRFFTESEVNHRRRLAVLGQTPVKTRDNPGFILNYFLVPFNNDAIRLVEAGVAEPADIDRAVKAGLGYPLGPLELLDLVGLDTHLLVAEALYASTHDPRAACPPLVKRMIAAGHLGRKTGRGFFNYSGNAMFGG